MILRRRLEGCRVKMRPVTATAVRSCLKTAVRQRSLSASLKTARSPAELAVTVKTGFGPRISRQVMIWTVSPAVTPVRESATVTAAPLRFGAAATRSLKTVSSRITVLPAAGAASPVMPAIRIIVDVTAGAETTRQDFGMPIAPSATILMPAGAKVTAAAVPFMLKPIVIQRLLNVPLRTTLLVQVLSLPAAVKLVEVIMRHRSIQIQLGHGSGGEMTMRVTGATVN